MAKTETHAMLVLAEYERLGSLLEKMAKPKEPAAASGASNQESTSPAQDEPNVVLTPWMCPVHKKLLGFLDGRSGMTCQISGCGRKLEKPQQDNNTPTDAEEKSTSSSSDSDSG